MNKQSTIEVRGFMQLNSYLRNKYGPLPLQLEIDGPISAGDLAEKLAIDFQDIEVVFVNGLAQDLNFIIEQGDRVGFLPPGCPGPHRVSLGFYSKNRDNPASFKLSKRKDKPD